MLERAEKRPERPGHATSGHETTRESVPLTPQATLRPAERHDLLVLRYITEIRIGLRELHAGEHRRDLPHVLEMRAEVLPSGFRG